MPIYGPSLINTSSQETMRLIALHSQTNFDKLIRPDTLARQSKCLAKQYLKSI